jgi:hypothetical protein
VDDEVPTPIKLAGRNEPSTNDMVSCCDERNIEWFAAITTRFVAKVNRPMRTLLRVHM